MVLNYKQERNRMMSEIIQTSSIEKSKQYNGHILVVTVPLQGHAGPLMKLSHKITKLGVKVTFLTMDTAESSELSWNRGVRVISVPSGGNESLLERAREAMPAYMEDLLKSRSGDDDDDDDDDRIIGVIVATPLAWMLQIPKNMGFKTAIFWPSNLGCLALGTNISHLLHSKVIDNDGSQLVNKNIKLHPNMPDMLPTELQWYFSNNKEMQKSMFHFIKGIIDQMKNADWILCNWFHDLNPCGTNIKSNVLPIGPLLAHAQSTGSLCPEDSTCLPWLDKQPKASVIYAAFGSTSRFNQQQLDELAIGLKLTGRPFLWVAWSGLTDGSSPMYTNEFKNHVGDRGKIVEWAPQEAVLGHPSIACFITHCGWSSFMESLSMGVPLLCWPYFGDQVYTARCISDVWRVGMRVKGDESGIVSRYEIKDKVEGLLSDGDIRENVLKWKRMTRDSIDEGGFSSLNLEYLIQKFKS